MKWYKLRDTVKQVKNSTYNRSIDMAPSELLMSVKMRTAKEYNIKKLISEEIRLRVQEGRIEIRQHAKEQILKTQTENQRTYNLRRKESNQYLVNHLVGVTQFGGALK